jgi:hypothetical protein
MRNANLTQHAETRLAERSKLSPGALKCLLDNGVTVPVALQKGGRHAKRLVYSSADQDWLIVVQDAGDGDILTVMPLDYLKNRIPVTAAQRRSARSRVLAFERPRQRCSVTGSPVTATSAGNPVVPPSPKQPLLAQGLKLGVSYTIGGALFSRNLPATLPEHGAPATWAVPGEIHAWLRERLIEEGIPFKAILSIRVRWKGQWEIAEGLLEHLPLTFEEIEACR